MKLNSRLLITYAIVGAILLAVIGLYAGVTLRERRFESINESFIAQLYQVDFALTSLLTEVEHDVLDLVANKVVRTRDDAEFTSFLEADETTFEYHIGETEQTIIDILNTYRLNHPYANSVYMGRENGSFVRSHKRARPTRYDPRQRPWYKLAISSPEQVMRTAPYRSVTTPDVNIGTVKALVDEHGQVYGVVGVDITLHNLTEYISDISVGEDSYIVLLDDQGIILTGEDEETRFSRYDKAGLDYFQIAMENDQGHTSFERDGEDYYLFYYTSPELGWKISAVVPVEGIDRQVRQFVNGVLLLLGLSLFLLSLLSALALRRFIVGPIQELQQSTETIMQTGDLDHPIAVEDGGEIGRLANSYNEMIASIRQTEAELRASEEKYRTLVENINVGIFRSSPEGRLLHANSALVKSLGYDSVAKLMEVPLANLYKDPGERARLIERLEAGRSLRNQEVRMVKRDGSPIWVSLSTTAQYDENDCIQWLDGILEDVTVRREAEEALRSARDELEERVVERTGELVQTNAILHQYAADLEARNAELDAFAHTVAHDLKDPLGAIIGFAQVLGQERTAIPDDTIDEYLGHIAHSGRKMSTIIDALLLLASVREREELELQPLDMGRIVAEVQGRLQSLIDELEAEILVPDRWPVVMGYEPWVEDVWANYVSNGMRYGGRPPRVELGYTILGSPSAQGDIADQPAILPSESRGDWVQFWVRDNGPGLSPGEQAGLFTPFERLPGAGDEGQGLGLSIVKRIVEKLGGKVGVESRGVKGQGCTFYFTLPAYGLPDGKT